jgi:hypothetical protein
VLTTSHQSRESRGTCVPVACRLLQRLRCEGIPGEPGIATHATGRTASGGIPVRGTPAVAQARPPTREERQTHAAELSRAAGTSGLSRAMKWPAFGT